MASVTIRGSITPSAWLPRGEIRTVQRTPHVDNLIRGGWVDLIAVHDDTPPAPETVAAPAAPPPPDDDVADPEPESPEPAEAAAEDTSDAKE